ncbi:MAG: hypothetical protein Q7T80_18680 [Methanoregula sp.]|nr:hypothetical protein [Methanoregula sp.]
MTNSIIYSTVVNDLIGNFWGVTSILIGIALFLFVIIFWKTINAIATKIANYIVENLTSSYHFISAIFRAHILDRKQRNEVGNQKDLSDSKNFIPFKNSITIFSFGKPPYYVGEIIPFGGKCNFLKSIYLAIKINSHDQANSYDQVLRKIDCFSIVSLNADSNTFAKANVDDYQTWSYEWDTSAFSAQLKPGTYTVYALEGPFTLENLSGKIYGIVTFEIKEPNISLNNSQLDIVQGDQLVIRGDAKGNPKAGVQIWVIGVNTVIIETIPVFENSFCFELNRTTTRNLSPGHYDVIAQHPMYNNEFDVFPDKEQKNILSNYPKWGSKKISIPGDGYSKGSNLMDALIEAINEPNIDDIFTKFSFNVKELIIRVAPIEKKLVGDKFTIYGITNLSEGNEVTIEVILSEFDTLNNRIVGRIIRVKESLKVIGGNRDSIGVGNTFSYTLDTSYLVPSLYQVKISAVTSDEVAIEIFEIHKK